MLNTKTKSIISCNWMDLPKSPGYQLHESFDNGSTFMIEPLEKGFGTTLGNALRRIMLSSIQGIAVSAVKIQGVEHEFSTISGVKEDVIQILHNLKNLVFSSEAAGQRKIKLHAKGPCTVTAGMLDLNKNDLHIVNSDAIICHLEENIEINMDIYLDSGKGYRAAEQNQFPDMPLSTILVDSIFSPVRRVTYKVENTRVGSEMGLDRLFLTIETNGALKPETVLSLASKIMQEQLKSFIHHSDQEQVEVEEKNDELSFDKILLTKLESVDLSVRCSNCLKSENIVYVGDLVIRTEESLLRTPNFGRKSLDDLKKWLEKHGLHLGMKIEAWPPEDIEELTKKYEMEH